MMKKYRYATFILVLIFCLGTIAGLAAQTTETQSQGDDLDDLQDAIAEVDDAAAIDQTALLTRLSAQFNIELSVLEALNTQGYSAGQIWLALEISQQTGAELAVSVAEAASLRTDGHGWGVLAQALGIDPGSSAFLALKEQMKVRTRNMASEVAAEHSANKVKNENKTEISTQKHGNSADGDSEKQNGKH